MNFREFKEYMEDMLKGQYDSIRRTVAEKNKENDYEESGKSLYQKMS